jgi:PAS domain S-box-containing protein
MGVLRVSVLQRYGIAMAATVAALLLRWGLALYLRDASPFIAFTPAIAFASLYGGLGPGIAATVLGMILAFAFVLPSSQMELHDPADITQVTLYLLSGLIISWLGGRARAAQRAVRRGEVELLQSEERFHAVVEGITDCAIFLLDAQGYITSWNSGAQRIKGYRFDEVVGQHLSKFDPPQESFQGRSEKLLREAEQLGTVRAQGWRMRKDGKTFFANEIITALRDRDGRLRGFVKLTWDTAQGTDQAEQLSRMGDDQSPPAAQA